MIIDKEKGLCIKSKIFINGIYANEILIPISLNYILFKLYSNNN